MLSVGNVYRGLGNRFISQTAGSPDEPTHRQIITLQYRVTFFFWEQKEKNLAKEEKQCSFRILT